MNPIRAVTVTVASLAAAVERYETWLGYGLVEEGRLPAEVAASLLAPQAAGAASALMRPASGRKVDLRLIEADPAPDFRPLRTYGWAAIEICVENVHRVHARLIDGPFEIIGPPAAISALPTIHPMQVEGPDGDVLFLTEIKPEGRGGGLPIAQSPIDTAFICVLGCRDMAQTAAWFARQIGGSVSPEIAIPYRTLSRAFGLPATETHRLTTAERDGHIFLEFDQYPDAATERAASPSGLPPGVAVVSVLHPNLDEVAGPWATAPRRLAGGLYEDRRVGVLVSPEGSLVEVIEAGPP